MKNFAASLLLLVPFFANSQKLQADLYAGVANYQGDLQGKRFTFNNAKPAAGLGLSYELTTHFTIRGVASYMKISGDDKNNTTATGITYRNLNFASSLWEAQLELEYNLFDLSERSFTPYVFAGLSAFHFNPYSFDSVGNKVYLRSLSTEGQGLAAYPNRKMYKNNQFSVPVGGGIKLVLSPQLTAGLEVNIRKTFTDYLDDVSTTYVDSATLFAAKGPQAVAFAYRGAEIHGAPAYPADGAQRGNAKIKDWYYTTVFRLSYRLFTGGGYNGGSRGKKSSLGCPTKIY
ncbi:MAG: DUF6089 family protein [Ferruginibacter sp.]